MSIQIESAKTNSPSISIEKAVEPLPPSNPSTSHTVHVVEKIKYVAPQYDINIVDSLGGLFILLGGILLVLRTFGGSDFFGSIIRGVTTVVGGVVVFVYCFGMAIL